MSINLKRSYLNIFFLVNIKNYTMTNPLFYSMIEEDYLKGIRSDAAYDGMLCYYSPKTNNLYCGGDEEKISIYDVDKKPMTFVEFLLNVFVYFPVIFSIGFGVAASFIAFFVWKPMVEDGEKAFQEEEARIEKIRNKYENKYPVEKHSKVDDDDEEEHESLQYSIIMENVPDLGNVVMRYNAEKKGFDYWADRIIPQRYLCTVARKYVNSFKSFDIYTAEAEEILISDSDESVESDECGDEKESEEADVEEEEQEEEEEEEEEQEEDKEKEEEKPTNSVFATYKNYKTNDKKGKNKGKGTGNDKNTNNEKPVDKKINSFFYQGKINNFEILSKVKDEETEKEKSWYSPVTFADFKKLASSSSS